MRDDEIAGVLGHEITHISNGDMVTMTLLPGGDHAFVMFLRADHCLRAGEPWGFTNRGGSFMVVFVLQIVPGLSRIAHPPAWFSRQREFRADKGGAMLPGAIA